jgi:hypothetical protein
VFDRCAHGNSVGGIGGIIPLRREKLFSSNWKTRTVRPASKFLREIAGRRAKRLVRYRYGGRSGDENPFTAVAIDRGRNHLRACNIRNSISLTLSRSRRIISAQLGRPEVAGRTTHFERSFMAGARETRAFRAGGGALPNTRC